MQGEETHRQGLESRLARIGSMSPADARLTLRLARSYAEVTGENDPTVMGLRRYLDVEQVILERCAREDALVGQLEVTKKTAEELAAAKSRIIQLDAQHEALRERLHQLLKGRCILVVLMVLALLGFCSAVVLAYSRSNELGLYKSLVVTETMQPLVLETLLLQHPPDPEESPPPPPIPIYPLMSELPLIEHCVPVTFPIPDVLAHQISYSDLAYALHYHQDRVASPVCAIHVGLPFCFCVMRDNVSAPHVEMFNPRLVGYSVGNDGMAMVQESGIACPRLAWLMRFRVVWVRYQEASGITVERRFDRPLSYEIQHLLELLAGDTSCGTERLSTLSRLVRDGRDETNIRWLTESPPEMYNGEQVKAIGR